MHLSWIFKRLLLSVGLSASLGATAARADEPLQPLPAAELMRRLSLKLRRTSPTAAEVQAFTREVSADPAHFLAVYRRLVDSYLASPEFAATIEQFHAVWWRLNPGESTRLASYIVAEDRPYFEIFARNYVLLDGATAGAYQQQGIRTEEPLPTEAGDRRAVRLADDEPRFRSMLGALDFLDRFPDTPTNKNRARANYVFHTFLCETLAPTASTDLHRAATLADAGDDPHGKNPECIGCHYRLDPLARFFDHWRPPFPNETNTWYDAAQPAAGTLILRGADGRRSDHAGVGDGQLAGILANEPRVPACIAAKVWEMLMGPAVKLDAAAETQLTTAFAAHQSFKDLTREAALHPYFWSTREAPPLRYDDVKPTFLVRKDCHSASGPTATKFDVEHYPFLADAAANAKLMRRIWGAANHAPGFTPMPMAPIPGLQADALASLRGWIAAGADDSARQRTLDEGQIGEVLNDD